MQAPTRSAYRHARPSRLRARVSPSRAVARGLLAPAILAAALSAGACSTNTDEKLCSPGSVRCAGEALEICGEAARWQPGTCPQGQVCSPGDCDDPRACPDSCRERICTPHERLCGADHVFIYDCDPTGTRLLACGSCAAPPTNGICYEGRCVSLCGPNDKTYIGCEYFATDLDNARLFAGYDEFGQDRYLDAENAQYAVVVSNTDAELPAFVSVTRGPSALPPQGTTCTPSEPDESFVDAAIVPPRGLHVFALPPRNIDGTVLDRLAYRVASNVPITAYQFNPLENVDVFSNDASLLLPTTSLGSSYYVMTRGQTFDDLRGFLTVVGTDPDGAEVTVTVTARTLGGVGIPSLVPGESFTAHLEQYDVLNIETNAIGADLTGSTVTANRPVAVFGGSEAANAPTTSKCDLTTHRCEYDGLTDCSCAAGDTACFPDDKCRRFITCCADHLEMQMFPVSAWGTEYVAVRSYPRGEEMDVWRILAAEAGTTVVLDPPIAVVPVLGAGEWLELEANEDFIVHASAPVLVGQFLAAQDAPDPGRQAGDANIGDPSFILAVPERQLRANYVFLCPDKYAQDYVAIGAPAGATVLLDGTAVDAMPLVLTATIGAAGAWRAIRLPVADGYHELVCSEPCSVMVHGYDRYVSYGYPGGLNLFE